MEAQEVRSPGSAADTEWGPWALGHAWAAPSGFQRDLGLRSLERPEYMK